MATKNNLGPSSLCTRNSQLTTANILVNQYKIWVKYLRKRDDKIWELRVFTRLDDVLDLKAIDIKIPLHDIYRNVDL